MDSLDPKRGIIAWFANNPVAANLMMVFILVMGLVTYNGMQRQMFPQLEINYIHINSTFRGAAPQEIEEGILIKIEEALQDVEGIKRIRSFAWRGAGRISVELEVGQDISSRLDQIKLRVDSIGTFPAGMEPLTIYQVEWRQQAVELVLTGSEDPLQLKAMGREIENELLMLEQISFVNFNSMPGWEIAVEIDPTVLQRYDISLSDVSRAIRSYSDNISAGMIRSEAGMIAIRSEQRVYRGPELAMIPVIVGPQGERVLLGDIATIHDGFEERVNYMRSNGRNAAFLQVEASSTQSLPDVARSVHQYIDFKNKQLPEGYQLEVLVDMTYYLNGRLNMMWSNLLQGSVLVFLMLMLFLRFKVAFWVMLGLPIAFLGAIWLMPFAGVSINIVTLFAFIMVLGIVVDDAIVIGESAYHETEQKGHSVEHIIRGAKRVAVPATFGVLTTIAVFAPFMFAQGMESNEFRNISIVVVLCLIFSLIESKLILPAHLAHSKIKPLKEGHWRSRFNQRFQHLIEHRYQPFLKRCMEHRYATLAAFFSLLLVTIALIASNHVRVVFMPPVPHDFPSIRFEMHQNASEQQTLSSLLAIEQMIYQQEVLIKEETGKSMLRDVFAFLNSQTSGQVVVPLVDEDDRPFNAFELSRRWREAMPELPGVRQIQVQDDVTGMGDQGNLGYRLFGRDIDQLNQAGLALIDELGKIPGVYDISSTIDSAGKELNLELKPVAYQLGLTPTDIASQVGAGFYGVEAQRMIRDGDEVRVMVRYPRLNREQIAALDYSKIRLPDGEFVMLGDVAELVETAGISRINRENGFRTVRITANVDQSQVTTSEVVTMVRNDVMPDVLEQFPGVRSELGGQIEEQQKQRDQMFLYMIAGMLMVYILLAIPLKSYTQPLIVMSVIPFGMIGAVFAHFILGYNLSLFSFFGMIAAAGVVINDSLVLTDYVNQARKQGLSLKESVVTAGKMRFRAILLTSLTTFFGLVPIMFETSLQAQFVIPMAISLSFAVLFATLITLILVPCLYVILDDAKRPVKALIARIKGTPPVAEEAH
ncbi:efflux RND transporter permease subunit [Alkalimonas collagenimarina]|uniref:Efflux RND transporter permease subunit n=1 Tax=Alkalimonas collagenimarina TaxID=400390 RepID=A0ABT9H329_9GAMM|nr:efflux RND transporter permease subunit [Alkalimonas collagenimarina]MDP4537709.1 efflux RND transporter permease subunit [Alkalimonas collagenimarina]